jgi:hypothetical protein
MSSIDETRPNRPEKAPLAGAFYLRHGFAHARQENTGINPSPTTNRDLHPLCTRLFYAEGGSASGRFGG